MAFRPVSASAELGDSFLKRRVNPLAHPSLLPLSLRGALDLADAQAALQRRRRAVDSGTAALRAGMRYAPAVRARLQRLRGEREGERH